MSDDNSVTLLANRMKIRAALDLAEAELQAFDDELEENGGIDEGNREDEDSEDGGDENDEIVDVHFAIPICLHVCTYILGTIPCIASLYLHGTYIEGRFEDISGLKRISDTNGTVQFSLAHISALYTQHCMTKNTNNIDEIKSSFWYHLIQCVRLDPQANQLTINTQILHKFIPVYCKDMTSGYQIQSDEKVLDNDGNGKSKATWKIRYVASTQKPFHLELWIQKNAFSSEVDVCVVDMWYLREQWARYMGIETTPPPGDKYTVPQPKYTQLQGNKNTVVLTPTLNFFDEITNELNYDIQQNRFYLPSIEKIKLNEFINKEIPVKNAAIIDNYTITEKNAIERDLRWSVYHSTNGDGSIEEPLSVDPAVERDLLEKKRLIQDAKDRRQASTRRKKTASSDGDPNTTKNNAAVLLNRNRRSPKPLSADSGCSNNESEKLQLFQDKQVNTGWNLGFTGDNEASSDDDEDYDSESTTSSQSIDTSYPTTDDIFILNTALASSVGEGRMSVSCEAILKFLHFSDLGRHGHLDVCSENELLLVAQNCTIKQFKTNVKHILALKDEYVSKVFILISGKIDLDSNKKVQVKNTCGSFIGEDAITTGSHVWDSNIISLASFTSVGETRQHTTQLAKSANNGGARNIHADLAHSDDESQTTVLEIPLNILLRYVGQEGNEGPEHLICLLQFLRIYKLLLLTEYEPLFTIAPESESDSDVPGSDASGSCNESKHPHRHDDSALTKYLNDQKAHDARGDAEYYGRANYLGNDGMTDYVPNTLPHHKPAIVDKKGKVQWSLPQTPPSSPTVRTSKRLNIVQKARVRCFSAGDTIYEQGTPRHYFLLIVKGECGYMRKLYEPTPSDGYNTHSKQTQKPTDQPNDQPKEVDIGMRILGGDYSMMDGEKVDWCIRQRKQNLRILPTSKGMEYMRLGRIYPVYGCHRYTMYARTRVDICFVPLTEISQCYELFDTLLKESVRRYSSLLYSDIEFDNAYWGRKLWESKKDATVQKAQNDGVSDRSSGTCRNAGDIQNRALVIKDGNDKGAIGGGGSVAEIQRKTRERARLMRIVNNLEKKLDIDIHVGTSARGSSSSQGAGWANNGMNDNTPTHPLLHSGVDSSLWPPPVPRPPNTAVMNYEKKQIEATNITIKPKVYRKGSLIGFANINPPKAKGKAGSGKGSGAKAAGSHGVLTTKSKKKIIHRDEFTKVVDGNPTVEARVQNVSIVPSAPTQSAPTKKTSNRKVNVVKSN
jgi:hypothetical protein